MLIEADIDRARGSIGIDLHTACVDTKAAQCLDDALAAGVVADARDDRGGVAELAGLKRHVERSAADHFAVWQSIDQRLAEADD